MGLLIEYFAAPDDDRAAQTIDWPGGPSAGGPPRRWPRHADAGYPTLDAPGIEPFICLAMFEELLTGQTYDEQQDDPSSRPIVAERDGGQQLVVRISDALVAAVSTATDAQLQQLVEPWAQIEEFYGRMEPIVLVEFAMQFRALAQDTRAASDGVYCWVCV